MPSVLPVVVARAVVSAVARAVAFALAFAVGVLAQTQTPPDQQALAAARKRLTGELVRMMFDVRGGEKTVQALVQRSRATEDPALRFALLECARDCSLDIKSLSMAVRVIDAFATHFEVDEVALLESALVRLDRDKAATPLAFTFAYLDLAERAVQRQTSAKMMAAWKCAEQHARRCDDPAVREFVGRRLTALEVQHVAWLALAESGSDGPSLGRYLCFVRGGFSRGLPLLSGGLAIERNILASKGETEQDFKTCVSIAESWLARAKSYRGEPKEVSLVRRNLESQALRWYYRAWTQSGERKESPERRRLIRAMGRLEDRRNGTPGLGIIRFDSGGEQQMRIEGGEKSKVEKLFLVQNTGKSTRATCQYAFTKIRSVTIRGGIRSKDNLNFRFAVGPFNALCNWEVRPENHFYLNGKRTFSKPPLFQPGKEHEIRVRQLGEEIVFFLDDAVVFRGRGELRGTVCVYPACGSEIFVREILIDGDVDPHTIVTGPIGKTW